MSPTPTNPAALLREAADRLRAATSAVPDELGLAVAAWLESWTGVDLSEHGPMPEDAQHALMVARRVLGTSVCPECGTSGACNGGPCPLGTTTGQPATAPWPPAVVARPDHELYVTLRKAGLDPAPAQQMIDTYTRAILARQGAPAVDRAAVLNEAADEADRAGGLYAGRGDHDRAGAAFALMETLRRKADEAEYVATPCSAGACEPGGEPCTTHERLMAHAEGDHELCDHKAAEAQQPTPAVTETAPCGNTQGLGTANPYKPCARPAGHPEAYCKDATGDHLFLPATTTPATEEPK